MTIIGIVLQDCFVVLTAVEHADDGNFVSLYIEGDYCALLVLGNAQVWPHIIAQCAAMGESSQTFAVAHDGFSVPRRNFW